MNPGGRVRDLRCEIVQAVIVQAQAGSWPRPTPPFMTPVRLLLASTAALAAGAVLTAAGSAQVPDGQGTTSTTAPETTSTTSALGLPGATTTTTAPPTTTTVVPRAAEQPPQVPPGGGDDPAGAEGRTVPPEYVPLIKSVKRTAAKDTAGLVAAVDRMVSGGVSREEAIAAVFGRFPVGGSASYVDDWWFPRFTPVFHLHEGTDIFAPAGTPVRTPADGTLQQVSGPVGGITSYVTEPGGTYYYFAHLEGYPPGQTSGQQVKAGDVIGYVGSSGNAQGGAAHAHFEVHPARAARRGQSVAAAGSVTGRGLPAAPPKPYLDQWLADALAALPGLTSPPASAVPRALVAIAATGTLGAAESHPAPPDLAWAAATSPTGGGLALAQRAAGDAAAEVDWEATEAVYARRVARWQEVERTATAAVALVTPRALARALGWDER